MSKKTKEDGRDMKGYGSTYRRAEGRELNSKNGIPAVLGGQVWMVKPDNKAKTANPCVWMQAGVVGFKNCNGFYDCTTCKYDLGMKKKVEQGTQVSWQDAMRSRPGLERICRHSMTNRIERRQCAHDYLCGRCDFDQFFEDVWVTKTNSVPQEIQSVKGFDVPMGYYFHDGHAWARIESGGCVRVGMDDFSMKLLGKSDSLDLPLMGKELTQNSAGWGLKRNDNPADILSPVDGVIVEVNSEVREKPETANNKPYEQGWLFVVRTPDLKGTFRKLMTDTEGLQWMDDEVGKLENIIEEVAGPLAADGGYLTSDIYGNIPELGWERLTKTFLKS